MEEKLSNVAPTVGVSSTMPTDMPPEHARLPVWNAENWFYEDWPVGQKIRSLRRTISEGDSHQFNLLVTDIHPYVQDEMFARSEGIFRYDLCSAHEYGKNAALQGTWPNPCKL